MKGHRQVNVREDPANQIVRKVIQQNILAIRNYDVADKIIVL